jgi:hypothetical protein
MHTLILVHILCTLSYFRVSSKGGNRAYHMHLSFFVGRGEFAKADYIGRGSLCDRVADGDGGPVAHRDHEDSDGSAAPRSGRMTTTTASTAVGGGAAAIVWRVFSAAVLVVVVVVVVACGAVCGWEVAITTTTAATTMATVMILNAGPPGAPPRRRRRRNRPYEVSSGLGARPPGSAVIVPCTVITTSDSI